MPEPDFKVQGSSLEKGAAAELEAGLEFAASAPEFPLVGEVDDLDDALVGPTDFPDRPITHGASFGPGADFFPMPHEDQDGFLDRVATRMLSNVGSIPDEAKLWAARRLAGM